MRGTGPTTAEAGGAGCPVGAADVATPLPLVRFRCRWSHINKTNFPAGALTAMSAAVSPTFKRSAHWGYPKQGKNRVREGKTKKNDFFFFGGECLKVQGVGNNV